MYILLLLLLHTHYIHSNLKLIYTIMQMLLITYLEFVSYLNMCKDYPRVAVFKACKKMFHRKIKLRFYGV